LKLDEVHTNLKEFVKNLLPRAELISEFNGNFLYLVPEE